jgi:hypothetical protein
MSNVVMGQYEKGNNIDTVSDLQGRKNLAYMASTVITYNLTKGHTVISYLHV